MTLLKERFIRNKNNKKIGVVIPVRTFEKVNEVLENYGLYKLMEEDKSERLNMQQAKSFYAKLPKAK